MNYYNCLFHSFYFMYTPHTRILIFLYIVNYDYLKVPTIVTYHNSADILLQ